MSLEDHEAVKITSVFLHRLEPSESPETPPPHRGLLPQPISHGDLGGALLDVFCPKLPTTCSQRGAPSPTSQRICT